MSAVFVTGATGTVGSAVVAHLLERGEPVVAAVRPGAELFGTPAGAARRPFDFGWAPAELRASLDGCDRLFLMRPPAIADVQKYLFPLVDAARTNVSALPNRTVRRLTGGPATRLVQFVRDHAEVWTHT